MPAYNVIDHVSGKRLEVRCGDQRVVVDRKKTETFVPPVGDIRVQAREGQVDLLIGDKLLTMRTPLAIKVGFALNKNGGACMYLGDFVVMEINGIEFHLLPAVAVKVGGALMLKADRADDWQRANPRRLQ